MTSPYTTWFDPFGSGDSQSQLEGGLAAVENHHGTFEKLRQLSRVQFELVARIQEMEAAALAAMSRATKKDLDTAHTPIDLNLTLLPLATGNGVVTSFCHIDDHAVVLPVDSVFKPSVLERVAPIFPLDYSKARKGVRALFDRADGEIVRHIRLVYPQLMGVLRTLIQGDVIIAEAFYERPRMGKPIVQTSKGQILN